MPQVVEQEFPDVGSVEQIRETLVRTLTSACCTRLRWQNPILTDDSRISPDLLCEFGRHGHVTDLALLQLCSHDDQSLVVENVSPLKAKDFAAPHPSSNSDQDQQPQTKIRPVDVLCALPVHPLIEGHLQPEKSFLRQVALT